MSYAADESGGVPPIRVIVLVIVICWQLYMIRRGTATPGTWAITTAVAAVNVSYWVPTLARPGGILDFLPTQLVTLCISVTILAAFAALMAFQLNVDRRGRVLARLRRPTWGLLITAAVLTVIAIYAWWKGQELSIVNRPGMNGPSSAYALVDRAALSAVLAWVSVRSFQAARSPSLGPPASGSGCGGVWQDAWAADRIAVIAGVMVGIGTGDIAVFTALDGVFTTVVATGGPVVALPAWVGPAENLLAIVALVGGYTLHVVLGRGRALGGWLGEANTYVQLTPLINAVHALFPEAEHPAVPLAPVDEISRTVASRTQAALDATRPARAQHQRRPTLTYRVAGRAGECFDGLKRLDVVDRRSMPWDDDRRRGLATTLGELLPAHPRLRESGLDAPTTDNLIGEAQQDLHELKKLSRALVRRRPGSALRLGTVS